jgi:hypothetical protein
MPFSIFPKKKSDLDLRPKESDMPIPIKMREKLLANSKTRIINGNTLSDSLEAPLADQIGSTAQQTNSSNSSGGGFFNFFGGSDSNQKTENTTSSSSNSSSTSFWDVGTNTTATNSSTSSSITSNSNSERIESSLNDLLYRFSRLMDRVELLEKKMERLDRRMGINTSA